MEIVPVSIDMMSGDYGVSKNVDGILLAAKKNTSIHFHLCGDSSKLHGLLTPHFDLKGRYTIHHTDSVVPSDMQPSKAMRLRTETSLHKTLSLIKDGTAGIALSSANTGAYMALAMLLIRLEEGVKRPAIGRLIPALKNPDRTKTLMLDLGANADCTPAHLYDFAKMGVAHMRSVEHIQTPTVAILNIGSEAGKGNTLVKETQEILEADPDINFQGFVEGNHLLSGDFDIIVADGFSGNVALKALEGAINVFRDLLMDSLKNDFLSKLAAVLLRSNLRQTFGDKYSPQRYNGALLMGLKGKVMKSHGNADAKSFSHAILHAADIASQK